jgi:hypothetical protein
MPIEVNWETDEKHVVHVIYVGRWSIEDAYASRAEIRTLIKQVDYQVDSIHDMRQSGFLPPSILTHTREFMAEKIPQVGLIVIVGTHPFVQAMYNVFYKVYPRIVENKNFRMVGSLEAAHELIQKQQSQRSAELIPNRLDSR